MGILGLEELNNHEVRFMNKTADQCSIAELEEINQMLYQLVLQEEAAVRELGLASSETTYEQYLSSIEWTKDDHLVLTIVDDEIVGVITWKYDTDYNECRLSEMYVKENHRRHGYGKEMILNAKQEMHVSYPGKPIVLNVMGSNKAALALYRSVGFTTDVNMMLACIHND